MHVLGRMIEAVRPGGLVLDLQVIRPNPGVETATRLLCEIDGEPLFAWADAATAAVDARIADGTLVEEAVDDHDVRKHHRDGEQLLAWMEPSKRTIAPADVALLETIREPVVMRERCRLRRLRRT